MALELIGVCGNQQVFITPYAKWRLESRRLSIHEALQVLAKRDISYPKDVDGRHKIRSTLKNGKRAFLVIMENLKQIVIITGGES